MPDSQLHCGACQRPFDTNEELTAHLETCPAARALLPLLTRHMLIADDAMHCTWIIVSQCAQRYAGAIRVYCEAVARKRPVAELEKLFAPIAQALKFGGEGVLNFAPFGPQHKAKGDDTDAVMEEFFGAVSEHANACIQMYSRKAARMVRVRVLSPDEMRAVMRQGSVYLNRRP